MKRDLLCTALITSSLLFLAAPASAAGSATIYVAHLTSLNAKVTGHATKGEARFTINGNKLTIDIDVAGAPPSLMHLQHFHGFKDDRQASCPTAVADKNGDGIIDLIETEPTSGTTMVPFNGDPVGMKILSDTYPKASRTGSYHYHKTVSLEALKAAFAKTFGDDKLDLDRRVVYIHSVFPTTKLPASVASLGTVPSQVTLPIACGEIRRVTP